MSLFRKKPVVIEAVQYPWIYDECPAWLQNAMDDERVTCRNAFCEIKTLEGTMRGDVGDWIIRGVKGETYPCKPDIFASTYERVEADPAAPADGWRPIDDDAREADSVIVAWKGYSGNLISGEAYYSKNGRSWWWANTNDGDPCAEALSPEPELYQPMPSPPSPSARNVWPQDYPMAASDSGGKK